MDEVYNFTGRYNDDEMDVVQGLLDIQRPGHSLADEGGVLRLGPLQLGEGGHFQPGSYSVDVTLLLESLTLALLLDTSVVNGFSTL